MLVVIVLAFTLKIVTPENLASTIAYVVIAASIIYFVLILRSPRVDATERKHVYAFIPFYIASAAFWALFQQQFTFIAAYSAERLDRHLFGWEMPASWCSPSTRCSSCCWPGCSPPCGRSSVPASRAPA